MTQHNIGVLQQDEVILPKGNDSEKKLVKTDEQDITVDPKDITLKLDGIVDEKEQSEPEQNVSNATPRSQRDQGEATLLDMFANIVGHDKLISSDRDRATTIWDKPKNFSATHRGSILKKS